MTTTTTDLRPAPSPPGEDVARAAGRPRSALQHELNALLTIAYRDFLRFLRDRARLVSEMIFPLFFVVGFGAGFQNSIGNSLGIDLTTFVVTGVFAQQLFQSACLGIIAILDDRNNNFSQEIFVSPVSRYTIVMGKITGESMVALLQGLPILAIGLVLGMRFGPLQLLGLFVTGVAACLLGGAFGLIILANITSRQAATQIFTFVLFPQYFLAGVFVPVTTLPEWLELVSRIMPIRYAIDLTRSVFYNGLPEYPLVVADPPVVSLAIGAVFFSVCLFLGTTLFVRRESNR